MQGLSNTGDLDAALEHSGQDVTLCITTERTD